MLEQSRLGLLWPVWVGNCSGRLVSRRVSLRNPDTLHRHPLVCPNCGADMRIIAFITEAAPVEQILTHIGEPPRPPPISPARGPPAWDEAPEPMPDWDLLQQPEFDFEFDQRVAW